MTPTVDCRDSLLSCVCIQCSEEQFLAWISSRQPGYTCAFPSPVFLFTFWGSQNVMEGWSGSTLSSSFRVPGFSNCVWVSAQTSVCSPLAALGLLSNPVSAQWSGGGKGKKHQVNTDSHTSIAASDWTQRCSWWMMLIIIVLAGCSVGVLKSTPSL